MRAAKTRADIARLRALHAEMDAAVLRAYGWDDLADRAAPEFIEQDADEGKTPKTRLDWPAEFKDEVLARLLALNAERAAAERAAGLTAAAGGRTKRLTKTRSTSGGRRPSGLLRSAPLVRIAQHWSREPARRKCPAHALLSPVESLSPWVGRTALARSAPGLRTA